MKSVKETDWNRCIAVWGIDATVQYREEDSEWEEEFVDCLDEDGEVKEDFGNSEINLSQGIIRQFFRPILIGEGLYPAGEIFEGMTLRYAYLVWLEYYVGIASKKLREEHILTNV